MDKILTLTGHNVKVFIFSLNNDLQSEWRNFATWYSIKKFLPEAEQKIVYIDPTYNKCSRWAWKAKVKKTNVYKKNISELIKDIKLPSLIITNRHLLVEPINLSKYKSTKSEGLLFKTNRTVGKEIEISNIKSDEKNPFIKFEGSVGWFDETRWREPYPPFAWAKKFGLAGCSTNEIKVLNLWENLSKSSSYYF